MKPEEREEIDQLCQLLKDEDDRTKFMALAQRLLEVLARKKTRLLAKSEENAVTMRGSQFDNLRSSSVV